MATAVQVRKLQTIDALRAHLDASGIELPLDDEVEVGPDAPLARSYTVGDQQVGNRFCILPMEGWDGTADGRPTELVERRWRRFGQSGAKLIWGGEAVAVRHDGRANPNQLRIGPDTVDDLARLRTALVDAHGERFDSTDDLYVGLQLTHSGRWARPDGTPAPRVAYRHPMLDRRVGVTDDAAVLSDDELAALADDFVAAAHLAHDAGFAFIDVKHCHGYLGHELLTAVDRPGPYGGGLDGRMHFTSDVLTRVRRELPDLAIGVRLSVFDIVPFAPDDTGVGRPDVDAVGRPDVDAMGRPDDHPARYPYAFGGDGTGDGIDLTEPLALVDRLVDLGVSMICTTAGSPYYNPHVQRPAFFPPSDGYTPPEDPLRGVARQLAATAALKAHRPDVVVVGSAYSYLQEWLAHVGQAVVRDGGADAIGLGRMALSYPDLPADVLAGRPLDRRHLCRTFSDCTTAPRNGVVSGCYPLDEFYKGRPERVEVAAAKRAMTGGPARR
jgi:2,4-dienoyl-CoA reductase-like NADH-dependent reductase (Old Yellow Enzyme family)